MLSINPKMPYLVILVLLNHNKNSWKTDSLPFSINHSKMEANTIFLQFEK